MLMFSMHPGIYAARNLVADHLEYAQGRLNYKHPAFELALTLDHYQDRERQGVMLTNPAVDSQVQSIFISKTDDPEDEEALRIQLAPLRFHGGPLPDEGIRWDVRDSDPVSRHEKGLEALDQAMQRQRQRFDFGTTTLKSPLEEAPQVETAGSLLLSEQYLQVLLMTEGPEPIDARFFVDAYQNGREQGFVLWNLDPAIREATDADDPVKLHGIYLSRNRTSDNMTLSAGPYYGRSISEKAYRNRQIFSEEDGHNMESVLAALREQIQSMFDEQVMADAYERLGLPASESLPVQRNLLRPLEGISLAQARAEIADQDESALEPR